VSLSLIFEIIDFCIVPSNLFLNKIGLPAIYLPCCMIVWGVISATTGAVHSYGGLIAVRFFLGFVEAAYFPGVLFFLSSWYTRKELGLRTALLYSGRNSLFLIILSIVRDLSIINRFSNIWSVFWSHYCWYNERSRRL
jgi:MFS family permease